jgi:hypothetical protein
MRALLALLILRVELALSTPLILPQMIALVLALIPILTMLQLVLARVLAQALALALILALVLARALMLALVLELVLVQVPMLVLVSARSLVHVQVLVPVLVLVLALELMMMLVLVLVIKVRPLLQEGILSRHLLSRKGYANRSGFLGLCPRNVWGQELSVFPKKPLTIYERYQIVIAELEIGAVGTVYSRRLSWWARENPGKARTWKSMKNVHLLTHVEFVYFWMKLGAS